MRIPAAPTITHTPLAELPRPLRDGAAISEWNAWRDAHEPRELLAVFTDQLGRGVRIGEFRVFRPTTREFAEEWARTLAPGDLPPGAGIIIPVVEARWAPTAPGRLIPVPQPRGREHPAVVASYMLHRPVRAQDCQPGRGGLTMLARPVRHLVDPTAPLAGIVTAADPGPVRRPARWSDSARPAPDADRRG